MEYISKRKKCVTLEDHVDKLQNGRSSDDEAVIVTFDDGYKDNFLNAFPIMKKHNVTATFFLPTSYVGFTNKWDESLGEVKSYLMSWDEIKIMNTHGMSFGSHGCTHSRLTRCSREVVEQELQDSKNILEAELNRVIRLFSFPYGDSDTKAIACARSVGYVAVCSDQRVRTNHLGLYLFNRIPIYEQDSFGTFRIKVSGYYDWYENMLSACKILGLKRRIERCRAWGRSFLREM
jgi:peptidoglycan/xylan/chitin deacetylase (PgdA/CDA1 family)